MWFWKDFLIFPSLSFLSYKLGKITTSTAEIQQAKHYCNDGHTVCAQKQWLLLSLWQLFTRNCTLMLGIQCGQSHISYYVQHDTFQLFEDRCHVPLYHIHACLLRFLSYYSQHKISPRNLSSLAACCLVSVSFCFCQCPFRIWYTMETPSSHGDSTVNLRILGGEFGYPLL